MQMLSFSAWMGRPLTVVVTVTVWPALSAAVRVYFPPYWMGKVPPTAVRPCSAFRSYPLMYTPVMGDSLGLDLVTVQDRTASSPSPRSARDREAMGRSVSTWVISSTTWLQVPPFAVAVIR